MLTIARAIIFLVVFCVVVGPAAIAQSSYFDPDTGLRIHNYTDPVPNHVPGGTVLSTAGVKNLVDSGDVASSMYFQFLGSDMTSSMVHGQTTNLVTIFLEVFGCQMLGLEGRHQIC